MPFDLITVCIFGLKNKGKLNQILLPNSNIGEADTFDFHLYENDNNLYEILADKKPQVIATFNKNPEKELVNLWNAPIEVRKRCINLGSDNNFTGASIANKIMNCYIDNVINKNRFPDLPLVSVFTPTYKTGDLIQRPFKSLVGQSYNNWEWVLYDDSPDNDKTFNELKEIEKKDYRISLFKAGKPYGSIGEVKRRAASLCRGSILVELDHDDELTVDALQYVVNAFKRYPDAGFAYTDCTEVYEDGVSHRYPDGWGWGYGSYRQEIYKGKEYNVINAPDINSKTIRHIVAAPNHIRAWKKDFYESIGGHNSEVHVADDYELMIRTFLKTKMIHIKKLAYLQHYNRASFENDKINNNTQMKRNKEIQRLVKYFAWKYNEAIHKRFEELGVNDFAYIQGGGMNMGIKNPTTTEIANYIYE